MSQEYRAHAIEEKWRTWWEERGADATPTDPAEPTYVLEMFAYPSGDIHMGHFRNYTIGDVVARCLRMQARDVLHPFGWDAFGLPAENAAIDRGVHPAEWTYANIRKSRATLQRMGISYDWEREIITCHESYYQFTQWMFLLLHERGLADRRLAEVNWCPVDQTVLANEHVVDGCCWRHPETPVERRELEQWFFRITDYADRLLEGLDRLDGWPESTVKRQRDWIGRSEGAEIEFELEGDDDTLTVFTTRPDTLWGATFLILSPEHHLAREVAVGAQRDGVLDYIAAAQQKSEIERTDVSRERDGVFSGSHAVHPMTGEPLPIWIADYVLATYGTGAIMAVPAHDERDLDFARRHDLEVRVVIQPDGERLEADQMVEAYTGEGTMVASGSLDGLSSQEAISAIVDRLEEEGIGRAAVQYRLRDWLISRQRYWGCPIPMIHCEECGIVPVPREDLPVRLPENVTEFVPTGRSPLEDVPEFIDTECPECGGAAKRDPDTMDTFVDSSWYHLRYVDPHNDEEPFSPEEAATWLPIDFYVGGDTHATGHLLYFRFFTKVLHDAGWLEVDEPAVRLFHQGMVQDAEGQVMSKSKGNVVEPAEILGEYGVDIPRLAMLFFAPSGDEIQWNEQGIEGVRRFVHRLWSTVVDLVADPRFDDEFGHEQAIDPSTLGERAREVRRFAHRAVERTAFALDDALQFNVAIAAYMELLNAIRGVGEAAAWSDEDLPALVEALRLTARGMAPLAPHLGEELWERLGGEPSVFDRGWPQPDPEALRLDEVEIPVQVNGKLRSRIYLAPDASEREMEEAALADEQIQQILGGDDPRRVIVVPGRLVNLVV